MPLKVLLADDHGIVRNGLKSMLERQKELDLEVVGEAENGLEAVEKTGLLKPDIVIMDVSMPVLNGIEAARRIIAEHPHIKIMALSMHSSRRFVADMLKAGVSGYVLKESIFEELVGAIRIIQNGGHYLSPRISDIVVNDYLHRLSSDQRTPLDSLSNREREVLQLIAEGKPVSDIAGLLHISPKTVESNRRQIMAKLKIESIAELTKYAIREGLTSLDT